MEDMMLPSLIFVIMRQARRLRPSALDYRPEPMPRLRWYR